MVVLLSFFIVTLLAIGLYSGLRQKSYRSFVIADHDRSWPLILCSLLATMIGGSATFGIAATTYDIGFPALWWLGVGSIGLVFQAFFVSGKVRDLEVHTLAEAGEKLAGPSARIVISLVISVSWIGMIAGQLVALSQIGSFLTGQGESQIFTILAALIVILFTAAGGQLGVMRTDTLFFFLLLAGVITAFCTLFFGMPQSIAIGNEMELFNAEFGLFDMIYLLFIVGGTYFIGPDVLSRSMTAKDAKNAGIASLLAAVILLLFNVAIVSIAVWCKYNVADLNGFHPLVYLMTFELPPIVTVLLALGLTAALLSSASTCLITAAATIQNDLIRKKSVAGTRLFIIIIGIFATVIALHNDDIIAILTGTYSVYAPGIVMPLFIAICFYGKRTIRTKLWLLAVICGGTLGVLGNLLNEDMLPLIGMIISTVLALCSVRKGEIAVE